MTTKARMTRFTVGFGVLMLAAAGCADGRDEQVPVGPSAEARALGVDHFDIVETPTQLRIEGRDVDDQAVASVELVHGSFYLVDVDDEVGAQRYVTGRQLHARVDDFKIQHESEGYDSLKLPAPPRSSVAVFLIDPAVSSALARWGVNIEAPSGQTAALDPQPAETPYLACDGGTVHDDHYANPSTGPGACSASTWGGCTSTVKATWHNIAGYPSLGWSEFRYCSDTDVFAMRKCKEAGGSTGCGTAGPMGCKTCWTVANVTSAYIHLGSNPCHAETCQEDQCVSSCSGQPDGMCGNDCAGQCEDNQCLY